MVCYMKSAVHCLFSKKIKSKLKYFPSHRILKQLQSKLHRSFECNLIPATSYRSDKRVHFSNNQFMNGILTWFDCNSSFRNHAANYSERSSRSQHVSVREIWCFSQILFFPAFGTERSQRALTSKDQ